MHPIPQETLLAAGHEETLIPDYLRKNYGENCSLSNKIAVQINKGVLLSNNCEIST